MEEIALFLGWKPDDFERFEFLSLITLVKGYEADLSHKWEMVRVQCAYAIQPYHDYKKNGVLKFSDIKLPVDKSETVETVRLSTIDILNKDELVEEYRRCGFNIEDDDFIERILSSQN